MQFSEYMNTALHMKIQQPKLKVRNKILLAQFSVLPVYVQMKIYFM